MIPRGSSLEQIADLLEQRGVVSSSTFFQLRTRLEGRSDELKPGTYVLQKDMSYGAALDALEKGVPPNIVQVTIPEGRSRREIAAVVRPRAARQLPGREPALARPEPAPVRRSGAAAASRASSSRPRTSSRRAFPSTASSSSQLAAFKQQFATVDMRYARSKNLTSYDVLTIASMVEREAQVARERPLIASVIYNRLKNGIRLDIDATTRFAARELERSADRSPSSEPPRRTTPAMHPGLPPGPIGNPGIASIRAAARPARTGYIFYVVKPGTCGRHTFAETDAEFQRYVDEYDRAREAAGGRSPTTC